MGAPPKMDDLYGKNPIEMDDLGVPPFQETSIWEFPEIGLPQLSSIFALFGVFHEINHPAIGVPSV